MAKRNEQSFEAKNNAIQSIHISIDHSGEDENKQMMALLTDKTVGDTDSDFRFVVNEVEIPAHSPVLQILANRRQLVKDMIEKDRKLAAEHGYSETKIIRISGTTLTGFKSLLDYIYTGKVDLNLENVIELGLTANRVKFLNLVKAIAQQLQIHTEDCIRAHTVDDLYTIGRSAGDVGLLKACNEYLDRNAALLQSKFMRADNQMTDSPNHLTVAFDKPRIANYVHFLIPENIEICFNIKVSTDRKAWTTVVKNDEIWSQFWNWTYFEEMKVKYVRIEMTACECNFDIRSIDLNHFLCKRADIDLNFDQTTGLLIPVHDIIEFPIARTQWYFDERQSDGFSYVTSQAIVSDKEKYYIYHSVGEVGKHIEFYLPQTCLIDAIRFRLWDLDKRTYDYTVEVRDDLEQKESQQNWTLIKDGNKNVFKYKKSWQTVSLGPKPRPVRWIRITGLRSPVHDPEFAIIHFECPPQNRSGID